MPASNFRPILLSALIGTAVGTPLVGFAYQVQGGRSSDFFIVGAIAGAIIACALACNLVSVHVVSSAIGSILALTVFQVPVCDGSHIGMPLVGMLAGLIVSSAIERFRPRQAAA